MDNAHTAVTGADATWEDCAAALGWEYIPALDQWKDAHTNSLADDAEMACDMSGFETLDEARAHVADAEGRVSEADLSALATIKEVIDTEFGILPDKNRAAILLALLRHRVATTADLQARLDAAEARVAELVDGLKKARSTIRRAANTARTVGQARDFNHQADSLDLLLTTTRNADAQGGGM